ncbi:MAG: hypothetical protein H6810_03870 [Phycisphaeraceae bacterium]|nr:MAG: hypothetical protein H6810_03870 [Phycisphaeraceae bacterium]
MRLNTTAAIAFSVLAAGLLGGCQATQATRMTVMNETASPVLVDVKTTEPEQIIYQDERIDAGAVQGFAVSHEGDGNAAFRLGVRPVGVGANEAQWLEFGADGPYLVRVTGDVNSFKFIVTRDQAPLEVRDLPEPRLHRIGGEPPVNPSHN